MAFEPVSMACPPGPSPAAGRVSPRTALGDAQAAGPPWARLSCQLIFQGARARAGSRGVGRAVPGLAPCRASSRRGAGQRTCPLRAWFSLELRQLIPGLPTIYGVRLFLEVRAVEIQPGAVAGADHRHLTPNMGGQPWSAFNAVVNEQFIHLLGPRHPLVVKDHIHHVGHAARVVLVHGFTPQVFDDWSLGDHEAVRVLPA